MLSDPRSLNSVHCSEWENDWWAGGVSDNQTFQLFRAGVARLVFIPDRGMSSYKVAYEDQVAHLQLRKVKRVHYASASDCSRVDVVDCHPFPLARVCQRVVLPVLRPMSYALRIISVTWEFRVKSRV